MNTDPSTTEPLPAEAVEEAPDAQSPDATESVDDPETPPAVPPDDAAPGLLQRLVRRPRFWAAAVLAVALVAGWSLAFYYQHTSDVHRRAEAKSRAAVSDLTARLETVTRERDTYKARDDQMQSREDAVKQREDAVKQREDKVQAREDAVKQREDAVTQAEKVQAENTIHEGTWAVGVDIQPGTYRTKDPVSGECYWAIFSDPNGRNIVANDIVTGGRPTVSLSNGQYFTTRDCGDWSKAS